MLNSIDASFQKLEQFCEQEGYKGWDPFDGLNSQVFQNLPFINQNKFFRLAWLQFFKRNPINLRSLALVPKDYNNKGLGLFLTTYCNLYDLVPKEAYKAKIIFFADLLIGNISIGYSGACWGYNFDWQARAFFQPKFTPTVVATSFIVEALLKAYEITKNNNYLDTAISSSEFVLKDLNRTYDEKGNFSFSYSPQDQSQVYNASLLGARLLSSVYRYKKEESLIQEAEKAIQYVCNRQQNDGSWAYGNASFHSWKDSFHTGFNLECISDFQKYTRKNKYDLILKNGLEYYINNFFEEDGLPKYYNNNAYPVDIHSSSQLVVTLFKLNRHQEYENLINSVLDWTINNMQQKNGAFAYQKNKIYTNQILYMRWTQAWMLYALSYKKLINAQSSSS